MCHVTAACPVQGVPLTLKMIDFGNCTEQRFSCSLNATSNTCRMELGPVKPSVSNAVSVCVCVCVQLFSVVTDLKLA